MSTQIIPIILCGGSGSRLFPLSRKNVPKQFLYLQNNGHSLLQNTILRVAQTCQPTEIALISNIEHLQLLKYQLKEITDRGLIDKSITFRLFLEPVSRNTCPAICYALCYYYEACDDNEDNNNNKNLLFLPADHIYDNDQFSETIKNVKNNGQKCTIFGIEPTCPETGYGYIQYSGENVVSFKEKPSHSLALEYIQNGNYCWNSGMFMLSREILPIFIKYNWDTYDIVSRLLLSDDLSSTTIMIGKEYELCDDISIDYALIEKMPVREMRFYYYQGMWSDIGSYNSLISFSDDYKSYGNDEKDEKSYNYVKSSKKVITNGVNNVAIIETDDILLVSDLNQSQNIKTIFNEIEPTYKKNRYIKYEDFGFIATLYEDSSNNISKVTIYPNKTVTFDTYSHFIDETNENGCFYTNVLSNNHNHNQSFIKITKSNI